MEKQRFGNFAIGDYVTFDRTFTLEDFAAFSQLSGDRNALHHDAAFAAAGSFGERIVPLHLTLAPLSRIAGMIFPGEPSLYLGHDVRATRPVRYGEPLRYTARIEAITATNRILGLRVLALRGAEVVLDAVQRVQALADEWATPPEIAPCRAGDPALAIVTGAAGEIGFEIARLLAARGWRLLLQHRGKPEPQRRLEKISAGGAKLIAADLSTPEGQAALAAAARSERNIGLLIHAASPPVTAPADELVAVNFTAFRALLDAVLPAMLLRQDAAAVLVGSLATELGLPGWEAYSGAKAMAANLASSVEQRYSPFGVRGLAMMPGLVATAFSADYQDGATALLPQEAAEAIVRQALSREPGNAVTIEPNREKRGYLGFHPPSAPAAAAAPAGPAPPSPTEAAADSPAPAAAVLRKILRLAPDADLSSAALGVTPGWDSLRHLEIMLELETAFGIRFDSMEISETQRYEDLDALCRRKTQG